MNEDFTKYFAKLREFNELLSYGELLVNSLVAIKPSIANDLYGERIFVKLLCHGITLSKISPSENPSAEKVLWDISSSYAVARALIETFDSLSYIALASISTSEKEFRLLFWKLHAEARRLDMLEKIGSKVPGVEETRSKVEKFKLQLLSHECITVCTDQIQVNIKKGKYQPYHLTQRQRNEEAKVSHDYHNAVTMHLSSHVHTHPFSVQQIVDFKAGSTECIGLMGMSIQYSASFLAKAICGLIGIFPKSAPKMSGDLERFYHQWIYIAENGIKHY